MQCACLRPSFRWYSLLLSTEGWPGWVDLGGWLHTVMIYPPADGHPSRHIRERVHSNQFGFTAGKGTIDPIFILRQVQEKILEGNRKRYWTFVDLEKAFDRVPREVLCWSLRWKGISDKLVRIIKSMYDGAVITVRSGRGNTLVFEIKVCVHQGSCLSPLLFIIVMDAVSDYVRHDVPWDTLYADDDDDDDERMNFNVA